MSLPFDQRNLKRVDTRREPVSPLFMRTPKRGTRSKPLNKEDRKSAKGRKRESATSLLISKKPTSPIFAISLFRAFAIKII
jgi:hypothetical protein